MPKSKIVYFCHSIENQNILHTSTKTGVTMMFKEIHGVYNYFSDVAIAHMG